MSGTLEEKSGALFKSYLLTVPKIKSTAEKVEKTLKEIAVNWEQVLEKTDPLYAICHYFHFGCRYDEPDNITRCREILSVLDFTEWDTADNNSLREIYQLMKDHYQYIGSLLALEKLRSKKSKKDAKKLFKESVL